LLPASDTKSGKARRVPLTKRSTDILKRLRRDHENATKVFIYRRAGEFRPVGDVRKPFQTASKRAGISDFRIHDCRHNSGNRIIPATDGRRVYFLETRGVVGTSLAE
jgi:integrase